MLGLELGECFGEGLETLGFEDATIGAWVIEHRLEVGDGNGLEA